jgi:uncharacterized membrane protein
MFPSWPAAPLAALACSAVDNQAEVPAMLRSLLIGCATGLRSATPIAMVSLAEPEGAPAWLTRPAAKTVLALVAAGEAAGDKLPVSPDRIIAPGLLMRVAAGGLAAYAIAPRGRRRAATALGAALAIPAAFISFRLRLKAMERFGQVPTGLVEDALCAAAAYVAVRA